MTTTAPRIDLDALARALAERDLDALGSLYAEDVEFHVSNPSHPPAEAFGVRGRDEVVAYLRGVPPDLTITLEDAVVGVDGRVVAHTVCRYPDGKVVCSAWLLEPDVRGAIVLQKGIEAWDE
jgi:ketosteroid isomerase-like protein